ncbi:MAG: cell division protein ZapB [Deltaproteobacteria bacterium]|nr:cell division protein ZapB [Deltaproteobacteria bacterium]
MALENGNGQGVYAGEAKVEDRVSMGLESLKVLEGRVDDVLTRHASVVAERDRLRQELAEAQGRLAEMAVRLEGVEKERAQIRARVESILGRLEGLDLS